jgi:hypothetical protein
MRIPAPRANRLPVGSHFGFCSKRRRRLSGVLIQMAWTSRCILFAALALGALPVMPGATKAATAGVKTAPKASGSLERTDRACRRQGDFDAVVTTCAFSYRVDPALESDADNYSAEWLQIAVKPRNGWCIAGARGSIRQPGSQLTSRVPHSPLRAGLKRPALTIESPGGELGRLRQEFRLSRGTLSAEPTGLGDGLRWRWRGRSRERTVLLVLGAGLARPPSSDEIITEYLAGLTTMRGIGGC